jgi:DtxR family Mn-dependent transcriptional regulator
VAAPRASCGSIGKRIVGSLATRWVVSSAPTRPNRVTPIAPNSLTDAERDYLERLYWLHEADLPMTAANIARAMQLSAPAVHEMIGRLEREGYITRGSDKVISFTASGERQAGEIVSRHRLIERFLTDVLGIPWDEVHEEAERLEHAMSPVLEERMLAAVGDATTCPHGHPIRVGSRIPGVPLADVAVGASIRVLRFENEAEDLLHYLRTTGLEPGLEGTVLETGESEIIVALAAGNATITRSVAETVSVSADPSPPERVALPDQLVLGTQRYGR